MAKRESKQRVLLGQELGGTSVESDCGSSDTDSSTSLVNREVTRELADHEKEECQVEEAEEGDQGDVDPQGCQAARARLDILDQMRFQE